MEDKMDSIFSIDVDELSRLGLISEEEKRMLENADKAAEEISLSEYEHYLKHEFNNDAIATAKKYGLFAMNVGREYGGNGVRPIIHALIQQRLAHSGLSFPTLFDVQTFISQPSIARWGTEEQKKKYLPKSGTGEYIFSFGLTEPEAGSDPSSMKTTYRKEGNSYVINGEKYLISNGSICNYMILFAKSSDRDEEITAFVIDPKESGYSVEAQLREKIGLFAADTSMINLEDITVPESEILGGIGNGLRVAYSALMNGRIGIGSACIGVIEGSLKASIERAKSRVQHGKEIGKHQLIQQHISAIKQNLEMAKWPVYNAAISMEAYNKNRDNKELLLDTDLKSASAKRIASRLAFESADRAVQIHGGFGYSLISPVGQLFCDSRVARIYEGTDEIQDLKITSDLLGKGFDAFS